MPLTAKDFEDLAKAVANAGITYTTPTKHQARLRKVFPCLDKNKKLTKEFERILKKIKKEDKALFNDSLAAIKEFGKTGKTDGLLKIIVRLKAKFI